MRKLAQVFFKTTSFSIFILLLLLFTQNTIKAQHSVARQWNEVILEGIRNDFARPTVHARNLFHISVAMYDAWAVYDPYAKTYFLGNNAGDFGCSFNGLPMPDDLQAAQEEAISYAAYRLIQHRFANSPDGAATFLIADALFANLGYDANFTSTDYVFGSSAALGNYIAECLINFGMIDGANEQIAYANTYYSPYNPTLLPDLSGNPSLIDPNRWQPLTLDFFIDQSGNPSPFNTPQFLSPEWGNVIPFALLETDKSTYTRNGQTYQVWHDPGNPPYLDPADTFGTNELYQWNFALVSVWSSHLDPSDGVMWDISPGAIGNIQDYPTDFADFDTFYDLENGLDAGTGYAINPHTGQPYAPQIVPRGDYTRVLAEFWADGPDSETPPGHWFAILNYVSDHPLLEKRWKGEGPILDDLAWDVRTYFALGGAMHDAAITAWSIKGWHDYIRPISAIRYMADQGQSSDPSLPNYSPEGIPLIPGYIEMVEAGDPIQGFGGLNVGKIKVKAWRGPDFIFNPATSTAGVGWILAENWWPYQRPTFVTPPFAGYVSGHSTYSRAAADVMTLMTGDEYFPGGIGEFIAPANEFLVFEDGPSVDVVLQWAKYKDASDQCSLSRIWGGIHPPADDIPGRLIGAVIGAQAFDFAQNCINENGKPDVIRVAPNLTELTNSDIGNTFTLTIVFNENMDANFPPNIDFPNEDPLNFTLTANIGASSWLNDYTYEMVYDIVNPCENLNEIIVQIANTQNMNGVAQAPYETANLFTVATQNPEITVLSVEEDCIWSFCFNVATIEVCGASLPFNFDWTTEGFVRKAVIYDPETLCATITVRYLDNALWSINLPDYIDCLGEPMAIQSTSASANENPPLLIAQTLIDCASSNSDCQEGGSIALTIEGGTAPYHYAWDGPTHWMPLAPDAPTIDNVPSAWYTVVVTDSGTPQQTRQKEIWVSCAKPGRACVSSTQKQEEETVLQQAATSLSIYPNPLTQKATITFQFPYPTHANIQIFSIDGQALAQVFDGNVEANKAYNIPFEAQNLPSGIYLAALKTADGTIMYQRIVVVND